MLLSAQLAQLSQAVPSGWHSQLPPLPAGLSFISPHVPPQVFVSNPDGSPASRVLVSCQNHKVYTSDSGVATLTINTDTKMKQLPILVPIPMGQKRWGCVRGKDGALVAHPSPQVVTDEDLRPEDQASARMTAWPYSTQDGSGNFLHIEVKTFGTEVGNNLQLSLNTRHWNLRAKDQITHFTILVRDEDQAGVKEFLPWNSLG